MSCGYQYRNATLWSAVNTSSSGMEEDPDAVNTSSSSVEEEDTDAVNTSEEDPDVEEEVTEDCANWSNNQDQLCFDCSSCRAALLANIKHDWHKVAVVNVVVLVFLVVVYAIGCCAFYNAKRQGY